MSGISGAVIPALSKGITLRLPATALMLRKLVIRWEERDAIALMFGPQVGAPEMVSAGAVHGECRLARNPQGRHMLHIGSATFELTQLEADIVHSQFGPLGLKRVTG